MSAKQSIERRGFRASRRRLLMGGSVFSLGAVLAACAPSPSPSPTAGVRTTTPTIPATVAAPTPIPTIPPTVAPSPTAIPPTPTPVPRAVTLWTTESSTNVLEALSSAGAAFSAKNPSLVAKVVGGPLDYGKIIESLALTLGPDVLDPGALAPYATRGVLRALDGYFSSGGVASSNYSSAMWQGGQWTGKTYGVPALDNGPELGFIVNHSLTSADVTALDSWDKMFAFGLAATKKDANGIQVLGWDPLNGTGGLLQSVESITGQSWFDASSKKISLNNPAYQSYLDHLKSYYQSLGIDALNAFRTNSTATTIPETSGLVRETEAAVVGDYRIAGRLSAETPMRFGVQWVPASLGARTQRVGGRFLTIPVAANRPDDSWTFLSYLAGDDGNRLLFNEAGCGAWSDSFQLSQPWEKNPLLSFYANSLTQATVLAGQPINLLAGFAQAQWEVACGTVIQGTSPSADALNAAQTALETELQRLNKVAGS